MALIMLLTRVIFIKTWLLPTLSITLTSLAKYFCLYLDYIFLGNIRPQLPFFSPLSHAYQPTLLVTSQAKHHQHVSGRFFFPSWVRGAFQNHIWFFLIQELLRFQCFINITPFCVWERYLVWNFKGTLWNSTQNILPKHWKISILFGGGKLRALSALKAHLYFWNRPHNRSHPHLGIISQRFIYLLKSINISVHYHTYFSYDLRGVVSISWITAGIILCMYPANGRRRYNVTSSLIGWAHTQNYPWTDILYNCALAKGLTPISQKFGLAHGWIEPRTPHTKPLMARFTHQTAQPWR